MSAGYPAPAPFAPAPMQPPSQPSRPSGGRWLLSLALFGLGFLFLGGVVCVAGVYYVASNIDKWVVGLGREAIVAAIKDSELPEQEKGEVVTQVDRLVEAYKQRRINQADLQRVFAELENAPALKALSLFGIDDAYMDDTKLTAAEVEQGRRTFQRALRGVYEGKISEDDFYAALPDDEDDQVRLASTTASENENSSDDDLRLALTKLKVMADNARIADEPFQIDIGDEVKKLVDAALAGK